MAGIWALKLLVSLRPCAPAFQKSTVSQWLFHVGRFLGPVYNFLSLRSSQELLPNMKMFEASIGIDGIDDLFSAHCTFAWNVILIFLVLYQAPTLISNRIVLTALTDTCSVCMRKILCKSISRWWWCVWTGAICQGSVLQDVPLSLGSPRCQAFEISTLWCLLGSKVNSPWSAVIIAMAIGHSPR